MALTKTLAPVNKSLQMPTGGVLGCQQSILVYPRIGVEVELATESLCCHLSVTLVLHKAGRKADISSQSSKKWVEFRR